MTTMVCGLSDGELVAGLKALVVQERWLSAAMLAHLGEVDARQLYLPAACPSMYRYCVGVLGMAEEVAFKRIRAARAARTFPIVLEAVGDGRLSVSAVVWIAPHLTEENAEELVAEAAGKSKAEIEVVLARRAPRPDVAPRLEREPEQPALVEPGPVAPPAPPKPATVKPLAPERFELRLTVSGETKAKLERAQALMRHQVPDGDLAAVIDRALDVLLEKVEGRKFGKVKKPRAVKASASRRHVPAAVRREVVARDGEQCTFVGEDGRRCEEKGFLELDHVVPVARGGEPTVERTRVLCRSHNQYEARRLLGERAVEAGKAARQLESDVLAGLRQMGVTATDARRAVEESRGSGTTLEERLRAALGVLHGIYARQKGWRCGERTAPPYDVRPGARNRSERPPVRPSPGRERHPMSRRIWRSSLLALLAPLGCAAASRPQANTTPAPPLSPAMRSLAFYVGEWDCQGTSYDHGKAQPPLPYHVSVHPTLDGSWVDVKFFQGDTLTASELKGYDETAHRYRHIGGVGQGGSFSSSSDGWQGDHMVFHDDHPAAGEQSRTTFTHLSDTRYSHVAEWDDGSGAGFQPDFAKTCVKQL